MSRQNGFENVQQGKQGKNFFQKVNSSKSGNKNG
jgi:hypothetical protein